MANMEKSIDRQLHATLGKMELALGSINEAIVWTDSKGKIQWCNSAFDRLTGSPHIYILGKDLAGMLPLSRKGQVLEAQEHPVHLLMDQKDPVQGVFEHQTKDQTSFLEISGRRVSAGDEEQIIILSIRDVTELSLNRSALEKAKQTLELQVENRTRKLSEVSNQYKSILTEAVDAIITIDVRGTILSFNPASEKIFGYTKEEAVGRNVTLIIPAPFKHEHNQYIRNYLETGKKNIIGIGREVFGVHRTGREIPLYLGVSEVRSKDGIIFTGVLRDISEQKKAEKALKLARDEAESANRAKSAFLANMSHEIRTPMNAVLGFSELLSPLVAEGKQKQYLDAIMTSGKGLLTIINDILDLSKIEAGKLDLNYESVDMTRLLEEVRQIFMPGVREKGIKFRVGLGPGQASDSGSVPGLLLDEIRMRQILLNLAGNAVKFTRQGEILLTADLIPGEPGHGKGDLHIRVKDTGIGIPKDRREKIFQAFEQQESQTAKHFGGTGLGLTITRRLVGMMNGEIGLKSKVGRGSEFQVTLRDVALADPVMPMEKNRKSTFLKRKFKPASVLVVDDVSSNRDLIREMLSGTGIQVQEADNGRAGLDMVLNDPPDLLMLDIRMPGLDGHQVIGTIRETPEVAELPVICMTASASREDRAGWKDKGFNLFLSKPVSKKELVSALMRFLPHGADPGELPPGPGEAEGRNWGDVKVRTPAKDAKGLAKDLNRILDRQWGDFQGVLEMDLVEEFGHTLTALAEKYQAPDLGEFAAELVHSAACFEIEKVRALVDKFPDLAAAYDSGPRPETT